MKNIVIGALSTIFLLLILLFIYTVYGRTARIQELDRGLDNAMTIAAEMLMEDKEYAPQSNEEFFSDFMQAFVMNINSASDIQVDVLEIDYQLGILSVRVTSKYQHLNGSPGTVSIEKTIILEQYENENAVETYVVTYYVNGALYKEYEIEENNRHIVPFTPISSSTFMGWQATSGSNKGTLFTEGNLKGTDVTENVSYIAIFN